MIWKQLYTGTMWNMDEPEGQQIYLDDIVVPLSRLPRYDAHTTRTISVAEHSLLVARLVGREAKPYALVHDFHEVWLGDITTPTALLLFHQEEDMFWLKSWKRRYDSVVYEAFGLELPSEEIVMEVAQADLQARDIERRALMSVRHDGYWPQVVVPAGATIGPAAPSSLIADDLRRELANWCPLLPPAHP